MKHIEVNLPPNGVTEMDPDSFCGDPIALLNSRDWLRKALEAAGAKSTGSGVGGCQADVDIELEGCEFNVSIRPRMRPSQT